MKILLFGASGLLGHALKQEIAGYEWTAPSHAQADITKSQHLDALFRQPWDVVINAAAICDFDACEENPVATGRVNLEAPLDLARRCHASGALFVQFSSDYIFSGDENRLLSEDDTPHPRSAYGRQKAVLEQTIPTLCPRSLLLRLSWLYGADGKTFMSQMPHLLATQKVLRVATGKQGRCLYVRDAASWIMRLVDAGNTGLFNLVNDGDTSWEEFAHVCLKEMHAFGFSPHCEQLEEIPYESLGSHWALRPRYSCLDTSRLRQVHPPGPRHWTEALTDFLHEQNTVAASRSL